MPSERSHYGPALAAEIVFVLTQHVTAGAKAQDQLCPQTARINPCPSLNRGMLSADCGGCYLLNLLGTILCSSCLPTFARKCERSRATSAIDVPIGASTGVARKE